ncbi:MAG: hypothetical protein M1833_005260 [Piccolia ochrophora]|nr:MAG: hypothetical protein M1833_005260 [Piccolia ochrophora]
MLLSTLVLCASFLPGGLCAKAFFYAERDPVVKGAATYEVHKLDPYVVYEVNEGINTIKVAGLAVNDPLKVQVSGGGRFDRATWTSAVANRNGVVEWSTPNDKTRLLAFTIKPLILDYEMLALRAAEEKLSYRVLQEKFWSQVQFTGSTAREKLAAAQDRRYNAERTLARAQAKLDGEKTRWRVDSEAKWGG